MKKCMAVLLTLLLVIGLSLPVTATAEKKITIGVDTLQDDSFGHQMVEAVKILFEERG